MARTTEIKIVVWGVLAALMLAVGGCHRAGPEVQTTSKGPVITETSVDLTFRLSSGGTAVYRAVIEHEKSLTWKGAVSAKPATFADGHTGNRVEMTFQQEAESVDEAGNAVVRITVKTLKCRNRVSDKVTLDFDSARPPDQDSVLARLVGQSYRVKLSGRGDVLEVIDAAAARAAVDGDTPTHTAAQRLLSDAQIRERHAVAALTAVQANPVSLGRSWSSVKSFSFSSMGAKSFERVYTLSSVRRQAGRRMAVIDMKAIPAAVGAEGPQSTGVLGGMADNQSTFDGQTVFDLDSGQVRRSVERMNTEWVVVDPATVQDGSQPAAIGMGAMWLQELEQIE